LAWVDDNRSAGKIGRAKDFSSVASSGIAELLMKKWSFLLVSCFLLAVVVLLFWLDAFKPRPMGLIPTLTGKVEYCLTCHADLPQISASHPVASFGCVICHGGERLALDADLAHSTMRGKRNPSDLAVVDASCGGENCHSAHKAGAPENQDDHIQRVRTSIQSTYAGALAQVRYAFGAQKDLTARQAIYAVQDEKITTPSGVSSLTAFDPAQESNPILRSFAKNCLDCHLSAPARPENEYSRLTGCAACHTPHVLDASKSDPKQPLHKLTMAIPYAQCNTCHNRGNYSMVDMQFHPRQDHPMDRLHDYYQPIAQFARCEWTLDCIDCHTRVEAMGDGDLHGSKKDIQYIQCRTCHGTLNDLPSTRVIKDSNDFALYQAFLNPVIDLKIGDTIVTTQKGEAMWAIRKQDVPNTTLPQFELTSKINKQRFNVPLVKGSGCQQDVTKQSSPDCEVCHAVDR
jgi:hypothetical protein